MSPVRVLGACGLTASCLTAIGGLFGTPSIIGVGGAVMVLGNIYALVFARE